MADNLLATTSPDGRQFATTHWTVVLSAAHNEDTRAYESLGRLCQTYWYPLYSFVRRQGYGPEDAQDLTQGFFAKFLESHALATVDRTKGKFRSFLLVSLRNYLSTEWDRVRAQKRGNGRVPLPLDTCSAEKRYGLEPADHTSPDKLFLKNCALALLEAALERLQAEQAASGKGAQFERLRDNLMADPDAPAYARLAPELGMSVAGLKMTISRLRRRYRQLLREEIARTVSCPEEIEEEVRDIFNALSIS